jgi:hypothetical protein
MYILHLDNAALGGASERASVESAATVAGFHRIPARGDRQERWELSRRATAHAFSVRGGALRGGAGMRSDSVRQERTLRRQDADTFFLLPDSPTWRLVEGDGGVAEGRREGGAALFSSSFRPSRAAVQRDHEGENTACVLRQGETSDLRGWTDGGRGCQAEGWRRKNGRERNIGKQRILFARVFLSRRAGRGVADYPEAASGERKTNLRCSSATSSARSPLSRKSSSTVVENRTCYVTWTPRTRLWRSRQRVARGSDGGICEVLRGQVDIC